MSKNKRRKQTLVQDPRRLAPTRIDLWQHRLAESDSYWEDQRAEMDRRERLYNGDRTLRPLVPGDTKKDGGPRKTSHVRNIIFENIESQISSAIPPPKVTPRREQDEVLASRIEHFLRNELDRIPIEQMNDMAERTVPVQGGVGFLVEWDNTKRTWLTVGETDVTVVHPKQFAPQPGIYTGIRDMDWFIVKVPTTKETVRRKYGVAVYDEGESEPDIRTSKGGHSAEDAVTMYVGYEKGKNGINKYVWINDVELEDLENYQARRQPVCATCGRMRPMPGQVINNTVIEAFGAPVMPGQSQLDLEKALGGQAMAQVLAQQVMEGPEGQTLDAIQVAAEPPEPVTYEGGPCPWCGGEEFADQEQEYEQIMVPIVTARGIQIPGPESYTDELGRAVLRPTLIPYYKPDVYPIILQKSVSIYGQLLGSSDVDVMADQQNTINRMEQKIIDRLMKAGTRITLPSKANLRLDPEDGERWYLQNPQDKQMIDVFQFSGDLQYEMAYLSQVYEESRQIVGITDSFQGRKDPTATSGVAKEYAAAMSAGRLESKRVMKKAAYAQIFELMFKFFLAYADEPRTVSYQDSRGETRYETLSRYDFLEQDSNGNYWWNDMFLFGCDDSAPLAGNREAMWQETRLNLQTGAFGDPTRTDTLILFWAKMEELHYPGAGDTKKYLEERLERERAQAVQMIQGGQGMMPGMASGVEQAKMPGTIQGSGGMPVQMTQAGR